MCAGNHHRPSLHHGAPHIAERNYRGEGMIYLELGGYFCRATAISLQCFRGVLSWPIFVSCETMMSRFAGPGNGPVVCLPACQAIPDGDRRRDSDRRAS